MKPDVKPPRDNRNVKQWILHRWPLLPLSIVFSVIAFAPDILSGETEVQNVVSRILLLAMVLAAAAIGWLDILRISPARTWAVATHTFRESVRRRVLLLIPGAMLLIVGFGLFISSFDVVADIRQSTEVCIRVSSSLTILTVILLAAFSFPREIESRTIFSLLTKPLTRLELFLGKLIGLALVAAAVLALMGLFSYGYLHARSAKVAGVARAGLAEQRKQYEDYLVQVESASTTRPDTTLMPVDPPDEALAQLINVGLLSAMNWVQSDAGVAFRPDKAAATSLSDEARGADWQWALTQRGYIGLYTVDLPPPGQRGLAMRIGLRMLWPDGGKDPLPVRLRFFTREMPLNVPIRLERPPRGLAAAGWKVNVGEPLTMELAPAGNGLYAGVIDLSGQFLEALGGGNSVLGIGALPSPPGGTQRVAFGANQLVPTLLITDNQTVDLPVGFSMVERAFHASLFPMPGQSAGEPQESAVYRFSQLDNVSTPDGDDLIFQLDLTRLDKGSPSRVISHALVEVRNLATGETMHNPRTGRVEPLRAYPGTLHGSFIHVPRDFAAGGELEIRLRTAHPDDTFQLANDTVRLMARPTGFAANLFKSLVICFVQAVVAMALGLMASVFLSWPVALLMTAVLFVTGNLLDFVRGMVERGQQVFRVGETADASVRWASEAGNWTIDVVSRLLQYVLPDFTRFEPVQFIGQGLNIPLIEVLSDVGFAAIYLLPAIAIGYIILHYREVAR